MLHFHFPITVLSLLMMKKVAGHKQFDGDVIFKI